jgi:Ca-activated chloride channel family protein
MAKELNLTALFSRDDVPVTGKEQLVYALLELSPGKAKGGGISANLSLVLDRSGSMEGEKIDNLKQAVKAVVDQLGEDDYLSLLIFDDEVEVILDSQAVLDREEIKRKVDLLIPRGGTQISLGLKQGMEEIKKNYSEQRINRILLLTDGETWGDEEECFSLAQEAEKMGVSITALGIGEEWNENLLLKIAESSGAGSHWIQEPAEILDYFQEEIKAVQSVVVTGMEATVRLSKGVKLQGIHRTQPMISRLEVPQDQQSFSLPLGSLDQERGQSLLIEAVLPPRDAGKFRAGQVEVNYDVPGKGIKQKKLKADIVFNYSTSPSTWVNAEVMNLAEKISAFKLQTRALKEAELGNVEGATRKLQAAATRLLDLGELELAEATKKEAENLEKLGKMSSTGTKKLQYGTRKLTQKLEMEDL